MLLYCTVLRQRPASFTETSHRLLLVLTVRKCPLSINMVDRRGARICACTAKARGPIDGQASSSKVRRIRCSTTHGIVMRRPFVRSSFVGPIGSEAPTARLQRPCGFSACGKLNETYGGGNPGRIVASTIESDVRGKRLDRAGIQASGWTKLDQADKFRSRRPKATKGQTGGQQAVSWASSFQPDKFVLLFGINGTGPMASEPADSPASRPASLHVERNLPCLRFGPSLAPTRQRVSLISM